MEDRPGEGKPTSRQEVKDSGLRNSVMNVHKSHVGYNTPRRSEEIAERRLGGLEKPPTKLEIESLRDSNPQEWKALKGAGMTDEEIYKSLATRH